MPVQLPAGDQWVGNQDGNVRFAVPVSWLVIDPSKLGGAGIESSPTVRDLASRMGTSPEVLAAQIKGIKVMAAYPGKSHVNAELTTSPLSQMPSDIALSTEVGILTGHPGSAQIAHRNGAFGDMAVVRFATTVAGVTTAIRSELAVFIVEGQVWILTVSGTDASTVDRAFNHALATLSPW